ncbi:MAG TPA: tRNA 2-thiouridine(34) synthase MnmA [Alphaproteobacteria bacterium]|nr:tRNA 2-thiouridine(34) synthase MnmA [Alphaproteobacteria bacterium]
MTVALAPSAARLDGVPAGARVVVAMSGGVDSSATAALLVEQGYDVVGVTLQLYDHGAVVGRKGACCAGQDIHDARTVADRLGIAHYVLDYERRFEREVIDAFADAYARGETPIPCVDCNRTVKFRDLVRLARDLGAECMATGHYARRVAGAASAELHRADDASRDQSYFLFATTQAQLEFLRFPLGVLAKERARAAARRFDLPVAAKPDSQDICFVPNGRYADIVAKLRPGADEPGEIVGLDGAVLGEHPGIIHYTVGQRRGLGLGGAARADDEPLYVVRLEAATRRVVVGPRAALAVRRVQLRDVNWIAGGGGPPGEGVEVDVKLRSTASAVAATLCGAQASTAEIVLDRAEFGVAPGQACVFYRGSRVLGGGWIAETDR